MAQLYSMEDSVAERIAAVHYNVAEYYGRMADFCSKRQQQSNVNAFLRLAHETKYLAEKIDLDSHVVDGRVDLEITIGQLVRETSRYAEQFVPLEVVRGDLGIIIHDIVSKYHGFSDYNFREHVAKGKANILIFPNTSPEHANRQLQHAESH